jgi:phosphate transport system substrate-binding protein
MKISKNIAKGLIGVMILGTTFAGTIQIKGSDTIVNLAQKLAESYGAINKGADISVTGGGSGTGIAALLDSQTDIANSSRTIKESELKSGKTKGLDIKEFTIGIDALSVIVNPKNKIASMNMETIGKIFKGEIKNWKEVGGKDMPINLYGRQSNSGTFSFFREHVLKGEYSDQMNSMNGNSQIVESIKNDISGIGYVGVGYVVNDGKVLTSVKILNVSQKEGEIAYSPTDVKNIYTGKYPISRGLQQYTPNKPVGEVKAFIEYELSKAGQAIVKEEGFYPIDSEFKKLNDKNL